MPKILGIEIGASKIRICEEDYKAKNPKVYSSFSVETPQGAVTDGILSVNEELAGAIRSALAEHRIRTKQVIFSVNSTKIASREVTIPFVKENKIKDLVNANVSDYFPVDLEQYEIGYSLLGTVENEGAAKQYKVLVFAAPRMVTGGYFQLAKALGLTVTALDYSGHSIYQIIRRQCGPGVQMVVKVDEISTIVTILRDQELLLQRTVSYGAEDAVLAVMADPENSASDYASAVDALRTQDCMNETVTQALSYLIGGIARVVEFFARNNSGLVIEQAYLAGVGADYVGFAEALSRGLDVPMTPFAAARGSQLERAFRDENLGEYLTCIGAAIAPIGFMPEEEGRSSMQLLPGQEDMFKICILVMVAGFVVAAALAAVALAGYHQAASENERLTERAEELEPAEEIYREFLQERYSYQKLGYYYDTTVTPNDRLVDFIAEMEEKMPSTLNVKAFASNTTGVTMSVSVADKKDAAALIQRFRTFETVDSVEVTALTDTGAALPGQVLAEEPQVSFTVQILYKGSGDDPIPTVEEPGAEDDAASGDADGAAAESDEDILE